MRLDGEAGGDRDRRRREVRGVGGGCGVIGEQDRRRSLSEGERKRQDRNKEWQEQRSAATRRHSEDYMAEAGVDLQPIGNLSEEDWAEVRECHHLAYGPEPLGPIRWAGRQEMRALVRARVDGVLASAV